MSSTSIKSGTGSERSLRRVMPSPNASITAATPRDRSTSTHGTDHVHLSSPSKGGGVVGVVRLTQTVSAPHTHVHTRTTSVSSGSLDSEVDTQRREAEILAAAAIEAALRAVLGDDDGGSEEQGGLSSSSRIIPRLSIKRDVHRDGGGLCGIGSSRESLSGLLEMGSASVSARNVSALAMSTSRSTYVGPPTALGSSRVVELIPEIITTTDPSVVVRANNHHSALEIPDVPIPDVSVSTTTSPTPSPAHDHSAPPPPPPVQVASPYSLLSTSTGGGGSGGVISPVEAMARRQSRDRNTNKKVNPKVRKSSVSALLERGVSVQELIDQYAADADRNKELWRERATLARLRADESRLVRERAAAKRDLSPRPAAALSPIGSPRKNNKKDAGGIVSYPSMWGTPVEVRHTNTKGPGGGDVPPGEEDSSDDDVDDDEYHINEYRIDEPGVTPEDDQSIGILKRAKEADHRMKREEEERRAAVLAERKAQIRESKYTPSSQFGGVTGSTPLVPLNGQDLHKRALKDLPPTSDQLRELQRERKRIAKEYADTNRALAEAKHAKKRAQSQLDNSSSSTGPSVVVHVVGGALVRDTPRRAPLDTVTTRGNDNMRSVAQEQRDRRERLAKQQQQQHLECDGGVGGGDSSSSSITAPVVVPVDDVDYDALRQRRRIMAIGGGYLQEQRDAFTQRKLRMVERSRVQQEQADEIERTANELKELRKVGHRLHAKELYGRQGKKAPFYSKLARDAKKSNSDQQQSTMLLVPAKKQTAGSVSGGPTPTSGSSSLPVVGILPPIKRSTPNTSSSDDDLLIKSAQAKIRMLQLLQQESSSPSSSLA